MNNKKRATPSPAPVTSKKGETKTSRPIFDPSSGPGRACNLLLALPPFDEPLPSQVRIAKLKAKIAEESKVLREQHQRALNKTSPEEAATEKVRRGPGAGGFSAGLSRARKPYLNKSLDGWVSGLEHLLLKDLTLLRCLGSCRWDVAASWNSYLATTAVAGDGDGGKKDPVVEEVAAPIDRYVNEENMFLLAPTTFYESADILLVVMSFSSSHTFFTACSVNKRWHQVAGRMIEARTLAFDAARGLRDSLLWFGVWPIAVCRSGVSKKHLHTFLRSAQEELPGVPSSTATPPFNNSVNGGDIWPMFRRPAEDEVKLATSAQDFLSVLNLEQKVKLPGAGPTTEDLPGETFTLFLGRSPTQNSGERVLCPGASTRPLNDNPPRISYSLLDQLNVPVLSIKTVHVGKDFRNALLGEEPTTTSLLPEDPAAVLREKFNADAEAEEAVKYKQRALERQMQSIRLRLTREAQLAAGVKKRKAATVPEAEVVQEFSAQQKAHPFQLPPWWSYTPSTGTQSLCSLANSNSFHSSPEKFATSLEVYRKRWEAVHLARSRWEQFLFSLPGPLVLQPQTQRSAAPTPGLAFFDESETPNERTFKDLHQRSVVDLVESRVTPNQLVLLRELLPEFKQD